jgi:hypothetical protein
MIKDLEGIGHDLNEAISMHFLQELRKAKKNLGQEVLYSGRDSN